MALKRVGSRLVAEGAGQYIAQMGQAATATRQVGQAANEAQGGLNNLNFRSLTLASTLGSLLASAIQKVLGGLVNLGRQALNEVASFERLTFAMESLVARELRTFDATLSMSDALEQAGPAAQGLLQWIQKLAIESPFDMESVAMAFKTAQAYGFTAQEAMNLTQVMIDFASATGSTGDVMGRVALALGQIKAKGKVAGQEILQLVNAGINVNAILAGMGFTLNDVSNGLVSADAFLKAFTDTMQNDFGGAAKRSTETLTGLLNTLGDLRAIALRSFFTPIFQEAQPYLSAFTTKLQELMPVISYLGSLVGKLTAFVIENREAILRTVVAIGAAVAAFLLIINAGTIFTAVAGAVTAALGAIGAAVAFLMSPLGLLAVAVAALAGLFIFSFSEIEFSADSFFSNFSGNMFSYGRDLVLAFAEGMATAINYVLDVLIQIGNIIAAWLAPGSPPKLLPNIDDWGTEAMNEYLKGFLNADFGIFNKLSGMVSRFIRSLQLPETEVIPRILGARGAIAEAIAQLQKTGRIGKEAIQKIMDAIGATNPALESYIAAMVRAEAASKAVKAAQERLNKVSQEYAKILQPMNDELDAIAERRQEVIDQQRKAELEAILADENAPALAKELALMELREIELKKTIAATEDERDAKLDAEQAALDKAKAEEEAAQEQLALQEAMIAVQTENNELIKQQIALLERLNKEAASGGGGAEKKPKAGGAGVPSLPSIPSIPTDFGALGGGFSGMLDGLTQRISGFVGEITGKFDGIGEKLNTLQETWAGVFTAIVNLPMWATIQTKLDEWGVSWGTISTAVLLALGAFLALKGALGVFTTLATVAGGAKTVVGGLAAVLGGPVTIALFVAIAAVGAAIAKFGSLEGAWAAAQTSAGMLASIIEMVAAKIAQRFEDGVQAIIDSGETLWGTLKTRFNTGKQAVSDIISLLWTTLKERFETGKQAVINIIALLITAAMQKFIQWGVDLLTAVGTAWTSITTAIDTKKTEIITIVGNLIQSIIDFFTQTDWGQLGANIINGIISGIQANAQAIYDAMFAIAQSVWEAIEAFFMPGSPYKMSVAQGEKIVHSMAFGMEKASGAIHETAQHIAKSVGGVFDRMGNAIPPGMTLGEAMWRELQEAGVKSALNFNQFQQMLQQAQGQGGMPITSPMMAGGGSNMTVNNNNFTGIGHADVGDHLDLTTVVSAFRQVINEHFPSQI